MSETLREVSTAARTLAKSAAFYLLIVLTLAIGIGPTTAIFSIVDSLLLREMPYRDGDSLVVLWRNRNAGDKAPVSGPDFYDFKQMNTTLSDMAIASWAASFNIGNVAQPVRVEGAFVTPNFFSLLGTPPLVGELPQNGEAKSVVLSHALWQRSFGGDRKAIGRDTRLNGEAYRIVAVLPHDFAFPQKAELWIPFDLKPDNLGHRAYHQYQVVGRLRAGVTLDQAQADLGRIATRLGEMYPETTKGIGVTVITLRENLAGDTRRALLVLFAAVVFLLLIACSNVTNLLLTRAAVRQREFAIRAALGASRLRLARQLLIESVILTLVAGAAGVAIAWGALRLVRLLGGSYFARPELITIDGRVLAFNFAVAALTGILFGVLPLVWREHPFADLKSGTRADANRGWEGRTVREAIVVAVVALSFFLLIGAGLLIRSFVALRGVEVGVKPERLLTFRLFLPEARYPEVDKRTAFFEQLGDRLNATPGIESAALISGLPLENTMSGDLQLPGQADPTTSRRIASFTEIGPRFFATAGVPILEGRAFTKDDTRQILAIGEALANGDESTVPPAIINRTMARRFFGSRSPLGERVRIGGALPVQIIGVVGDVRQRTITEEAPPHLYLPLGTPFPPRPMNFMIKSTLPPQAITDIVRRNLRELDPDIAPYRIRTMDEVIGDAVAGARFQAVLLAIFAIMALTLATIGIYGVVSYGVEQRTREMGIRLAAGATTSDLLRLVIGRVVRLALFGIFAGVVGAVVLTRWVEGLLFEVEAIDARAFLVVAVVLLVTCVVASARPARRAATLDPTVSLRYE